MSRWSVSHDPHAYLYKIAVNLLRDHWRRVQRERRALGFVAAGQRHPDDRADWRTDLRALLEPLPAHQRTAILLHYFAGFSVREVSLVVGRPEGTVKSDLSQARARLRAELSSSDD
jgi:RNA polymerase sigma-70 factor (ECF subfamily)